MKVEMRLAQAEPLAEKIKTALAPACEQITIAGSIRRQKSKVGDIEIVCVPKWRPDLGMQLALFSADEPVMVSELDLLLEKMLAEKDNFSRGSRNGPHLKSFLIDCGNEQEMQLELYVTTAEQYGYILAIRTGPARFSKAVVTQRSKGGLLPDELRCSGGWVNRGGEKIPTPTEATFFKLLGMPVIPPPQRRHLLTERA